MKKLRPEWVPEPTYPVAELELEPRSTAGEKRKMGPFS